MGKRNKALAMMGFAKAGSKVEVLIVSLATRGRRGEERVGGWGWGWGGRGSRRPAAAGQERGRACSLSELEPWLAVPASRYRRDGLPRA